jgi:hypothetical protein
MSSGGNIPYFFRVELPSPASGYPKSAAILVNEPTARQVIGGLVLLVEATPFQQFTFSLHSWSPWEGCNVLLDISSYQ